MTAAALESGTLFEAVRERLYSLIPRFGVEHERQRILDAFELICGESLSFDRRRSPPDFSRINADGTPIQFSLSFAGARPSPLQFLAEAGAPALTISKRIEIGRQRIRAIADLFDAACELEALSDLLEYMAPESDSALNANRSGVYWIGVSFPPASTPALTIYINSRWGTDEAQWERIGGFAAFFGVSEMWRSIEGQLRPCTAPLGTAITIAAGRPASGRVYASAYGLPLEYYRKLFTDFHTAAVAEFAEAMLGEERRYPIRSAVCSFEFSAASAIAGAKFEICAHCAFANDAEAAAKCSCWLRTQRSDAVLYLDTINILTRDEQLGSERLPDLHAYVGIGMSGGQTCSSIYLNPGPPLRGI